MTIVNPDDDGKDGNSTNSWLEKYLSGAWQSRILLALESHLPNEVDWAFNKLVILSFTQNFFVGILPTLLENLLLQTKSLFNELELNTSPNNFETSWKKGSKWISEFMDVEQSCILERNAQIFHILTNLSFIPENAVIFARDHALVTLIAKAMALPEHEVFIEIKKYAFDIFENLAHLMVLRGRTDFYYACLKKALFGNDRALIIISIKSLIKLLTVPGNDKSLVLMDKKELERILDLLLVPDEELVMVIMEFLYNFSILNDARAKLASVSNFSIIRLLLKFVHWKGVDKVGVRKTETRPVGPQQRPGGTPTQDPSNPMFNAALWLTMHHEKSPGSSCLLSDFLGAYEAFCRKNSRALISVTDLIKIVQAVFGEDSYVHGPTPILRGFRPKANLAATPQARMGPPPPKVTPSPGVPNGVAGIVEEEVEKSDRNEDEALDTDDEDEMEIDGPAKYVSKNDWICSWHSDDATPCSLVFESRENLFQHVKEIHLDDTLSTYTCLWRGCRRIVDSSRRDQLVQHVGIHLLELSKSKTNGAAPQTSKNQGAKPVSHQPSAAHTSSGANVPGSAAMNSSFQGQSTHIYPDINDELRGIPLTALLVLRNLARHPDNRRLYYPFEQNLATLVSQPRFSKLVSSILAEL